ncbi:hypothetical protein [Cysteiniphilum marinum]|uniref:hypothetical protein n=1 Tax=Cysteiniphilum marinum TaxID=2774191 RepID=UPI00193A4FEF|nr:hypothetical protein [Cysteiniphilum marinum]
MNFYSLASVNQTNIHTSEDTIVNQENSPLGNECVRVSYSSVEILPQDPEMIMKDASLQSNVVKILSFFSLLLSDALYNFYIVSKYYKFDPHVGDTACQIRAYQLINMISKQINYSPTHRIDQLLNISSRINNFNRQNKELLKKPTLEEFIVNEAELMFHISSDEWLLLRMYFLTLFKESGEGNTTYINYDTISQRIGVSRKLAKKIVRYYQINLAQSSCEVMLKLAKQRKSVHFNTILNQTLRKDDDARPVLPCYFYSKLIFEELQIIKSDILVEISFDTDHRNNIHPIYLKFSGDGKANIVNPSDDIFDSKIYFVITGVANAKDQAFDCEKYIQKFNQYGLYNIFLACMAAHPQYTGSTLSLYKDNPFLNIENKLKDLYIMSHELARMRSISEEYGCNLDNQSLFLVKHIYCDTSSNFFASKRRSRLNENNGVESYG